jgi:hypothetical protein
MSATTMSTTARQPAGAMPNGYGEYACSACGMPGADCLTQMNSSPAQQRCCGTCGLVDTHSAPPFGVFETMPVASQPYDCDGDRCGLPIRRGERYRRVKLAPWYDYNAGGRRLQPDGTWLEVPFDDLKALVAEHLRRKRIGGIEQATDDALLDGAGASPLSQSMTLVTGN